MQQFTVPQFIDVEDKIFGPITVRQFVIILAGCSLIAVIYKLFNFTIFLTSGIIIFISCGILAFFKINGMPFHFFILNFFQTFRRPGLRIWINNMPVKDIDFKPEKQKPPEGPAQSTRRFTSSRLTELSLIVDTQGSYRGENKKTS